MNNSFSVIMIGNETIRTLKRSLIDKYIHTYYYYLTFVTNAFFLVAPNSNELLATYFIRDVNDLVSKSGSTKCPDILPINRKEDIRS